MLVRTLCLALTSAWAVACGSAIDASDSSESALIGGDAEGAAVRAPSAVYLKRGCTAAKIAARRLLTAAHCVLDPSTLDLRYPAGSAIVLRERPREDWAERIVTAVHVHPAWVSACTEAYCAASVVTATVDAPDVAVIELAADVDVPITPVDHEPLAEGARVTLVGYGCTRGVLAEDDRAAVDLRTADASLVAASRTVHDGSSVGSALVSQVDGLYPLTAGPGAPGGAAGLCPGDSGGPLYRRLDGGSLVVVGVNANYTLRPPEVDPSGLPVTNWHTRLDARSRHDVAGWLRSLERANAK